MTFVDKFQVLSHTRTGLCVGIDPSPELLASWGLEDSPKGLTTFCNKVLDAVGDKVSVVKPQVAFFERFGAQGIASLKLVIQRIKDQGALALLDCKRGDIGTTLAAYSQAYLGDDSPLEADAVTVTPYLGVGALRPIFVRAHKTGCGVFVVVRSSNPEGRVIQDAKTTDGRSVADYVADEITLFNRSIGSAIGPVGAVVGATINGHDVDILKRLEHSPILAPGVGAQGASIVSLRKQFGSHLPRVLTSVSRDILEEGPVLDKVRDAIKRYQQQLSV